MTERRHSQAKTKLLSAAQVTGYPRQSLQNEVSEVLLSEAALSDAFGADLGRVLPLPTILSTLETLDLSFNDLTDAFWSGLEAIFKSNLRWAALKTLNLSNNRFTEASIPHLHVLLSRCPGLIHLDLSVNGTGYRHVTSQSQQTQLGIVSLLDLGSLTCLQTLDLSCSHVSDAMAKELVKTKAFRSLRRLYLRSNDLTDDGAHWIALALPSLQLQVLSLAGNRIGNAGMGALAFAFDQTATLQTLDVDENLIEDAGLQTLYHVIGGLCAPFPLRYLHIQRNPSRDLLVLDRIQVKLQHKILETHIVACANERRASEIGLFLALLPALRRLNLSNNRINDEAIVGLADGLEPNATLQELNLNYNQITDHGARELYLKAFTANLQRKLLLSEGNPLTSECKVMVAAISQAYDLRKRFAREFAHLEKLDFVGWTLRQYGAAAITELLTTSSSACNTLDVSHNHLGDDGAVEIAKLLREYPPLLRLDLSFNDIGDCGAMALADALLANSTLTSLSLHSSVAGSLAKPKLTDKGLSALAQALEKHKALTTLDLRDNVTPPVLVPCFVQLLQRNPNIRKFNGSSSMRRLYTAEFVLLVEFTEVIIPLLYCIYLAIVFHLTQETLGEMIRNVLTYSILEGASFFVLCFLLRRRTRLNGFKQLAFVLESTGGSFSPRSCFGLSCRVHHVASLRMRLHVPVCMAPSRIFLVDDMTKPSSTAYPSLMAIPAGLTDERRLSVALNRVQDAWEKVQVELHGKYSVERLYTFMTYSEQTSGRHIGFAILLTPRPCLILVALADAMPLTDPALGLAHIHVFWIRFVVSTAFMGAFVAEQFQHCVDKIRVTPLQLVIISLVSSCGGIYLAVCFHLPVHRYYPVLRDITASQLTRIVLRVLVLVYALTELVSFLILHLLLKRKLQLSLIRQLAIVLETQWVLVQTKLPLWMLFMVQQALKHFDACTSYDLVR
ncbi:hypothetical protein Poli38472_002106 [Pythium oligandrum]|uniref:Uncharacterized protein n=1 Tax=Pythium oligandrum TaxID=41045 RepID=A0A8K1FGU7_PYTOL|nr:hypothetical protein Poli38472_002106 [Pythium oligandrum]|eukprot:TMW63165.1 hypothetical protein Poli38472_002106 [Pythium oligandrum]